jgi:ABC-type branched-subunit amino acid transport system ATPase component
MLEVHNLSKRIYGVDIVNSVSFEIKKQSINALIGPNGAGKSTIFNLITGITESDSGKIIFDGREITNLPSDRIAKLGIGRTFQNTRIFEEMSVLENIIIAFDNWGERNIFSNILWPKKVKLDEQKNTYAAIRILETVGLLEKKDEISRNLSYGQRKTLDIARILALNSKLILLDEPMAGLSLQRIVQVKKILELLCLQGKTIFFIEHNMSVVMEISQNIVVLNHGEKIAEGSPSDIQKDSRVRIAYLGEI